MNWYQQRTLAWLARCGIQDHEEWPLFGVKKHITQSGQVWVLLTGLPPLHAAGLRMLLREIRTLEHRLEREGIVGWIQAIRVGNWTMRKWTEMIGADLYAEAGDNWYFQKQADASALPRTLKALVAQHGGYHHGSA